MTQSISGMASLPFSSSVQTKDTIYVSGIVPVDNQMNLISETLEGQIHAIMDKLVKELKQYGASLGDVVKTTVLLADAEHDWARMNDIYREYFGGLTRKPARISYGVQLTGRGILVEMDAVATVDPSQD